MTDNSSSAPDLDAIVDQLQSLYETSVANLREGLSAYLTKGERPDLEARFDGAFAYPELRIHYAPEGPSPRVGRAFGIIREAGAYAATLTRPALFRAYILEQLELRSGNPLPLRAGWRRRPAA
jgi:AMP nucleosidase